MPDTTATHPGQTAEPTSPSTETQANGTSGQQTTTETPAPTSPGEAAAPTSAPARDVLVAKVYGSEIPVDLSDRKRLQEIVQKGLAFDTREQKLQEQIEARADQLLQERAQRQAEEQRLATVREMDPVAYELEMYKKADSEKAAAIESEVGQLRETIHNLTWQQQLGQAQSKFPDLSQRDWNRAFAEVVASKGQTPLLEAARLVKAEKEEFEKQIIDGYLQRMKSNAKDAPPAVPSGGGGAPVFHGDQTSDISFKDKNAMRHRVLEYTKQFQGGG